MKKSLTLLDDLIVLEAQRDVLWKNLLISLHRGEEAVGESAMLHHLKTLKELIKEESKES